MEHTRASFVLGHLEEQAHVLLTQIADNQTLMVTDLTPFHPESHLWPDQPGDLGSVYWEGGEAPIASCRMGAVSPEGALFVDRAIPVKRGEPGWAFVVVHPLQGVHALSAGTPVTLRVDGAHRLPLSLGHSGCHLAALALNQALIPFWKKEPTERDALDQPDFDRLAITRSRVEPHGSSEHYRIGKSLRKKGVMGPELLAALPAIEQAVNARLADWLTTGGAIRRSRDGEAIIDSRWWHCTLDGREVTIPCGGTHATALAELGRVQVNLSPTDEGLVMETRVYP